MAISLAANTVAHYKLNDCALSTTVIDSRGFSNGTSIRNTNLMAVAGKVGGALSFNGTSDYVIADTLFTQLFAPTYRDSFSVSFWCKPDDGQAATLQGLFGDNGSEAKFGVAILTSGRIYVFYQVSSIEGSAGATSSVVFANGAIADFHNIIIVVTKLSAIAVQIDIYFDGALVGTGTNTTGDVTMSDFLLNPAGEIVSYIGLTGNDGDPDFTIPFVGSIDDVRIHNKALSAAEIAFLYNSGAGTEDLASYDIIEEALYDSITTAANAVMTILTTAKVYLHDVPQSVALPAITYQEIATEFNNTAADTIELRRRTYQFTCWADTMAGAIALSEALKTVLNATKGIYGNMKIERCNPIDEGDMPAETINDELKCKGRRVDYEVVYQDIS